MLVQTIFGADILLANARRLLLIILPPTLYLWLLDAVALSGGTWTIDPKQTTGWMVGVIPIEEMVFFFMTNLIIGFGMILMCSPSSKERAKTWILKLRSKRSRFVALQGLRDYPAGRLTVWLASMAGWVLVLIATPIGLWTVEAGIFPFLATLGVLAQLGATISALSLEWSARRILGTAGAGICHHLGDGIRRRQDRTALRSVQL